MAKSARGYSTREVARLLGLSEGQVRSFVRSGFAAPGRGARGAYRFGFQDLVVLRAAAGLVAARIPAQRIRRSLERLAEQLPTGRSLTSVRIAARGGQVVVREENDVWEPESGQLVLDFDFEVAELAAKVAPLAQARAERARSRSRELSADEWYELACELEAAAPAEAEDAYRRALELAPEHADSLLNLGRLEHEGGSFEAAESCYRRALEARPKDATAAFNLGVVLQDQQRPSDAIEAYGRVLELDPNYADAYFNLAGLYERLGEQVTAYRNLKAYRALTGG